MRFDHVLAILFLSLGTADRGLTDWSEPARPDGSEGRWSLPMPTLGGTQFWSDVHFFHEWRIQQHHVSGEHRLLDEMSWQHTQGSFEQCLARLEQIKREKSLPPMQGQGVVILHGLAAPRWSMQLLGSHLKREAGYAVFNVEYASTRRTIDDHAATLSRVLESLAGIEQIDLVGHSMGNIVIRRYLAGPMDVAEDQIAWRPDPRLGRIVMIAPPNHGSLTARRLSGFRTFELVFGDAGQQLGSEWASLEQRLATPRVEFGIIAGGMGNRTGFTFRIPGDDDGRISVETTRLAGAADFVVVPMLHELIANDPRTIRYTHRFLEDGCFVSPDQRRPIRSEGRSTRMAVGN